MRSTSSPFDTLAELTAIYGEPTYQLDMPQDLPVAKSRSLAKPDEYAVWVNPSLDTGCTIAGRYGENRWLINPTIGPLVIYLLMQINHGSNR